MPDSAVLAPCIAVVGPANSGKSTILHLLDAALRRHPRRPLTHVVPGSPDGSGRYLHHAPALREPLKATVKGRWAEATAGIIRSWVENCRRSLELVLLDFGGKHAAANPTMLQACSHFLVVAAPRSSESAERAEGMMSWVDACERCGLVPIGRLTSLWQAGEPAITRTPSGALDGRFRADWDAPGDAANAPVIDALVAALLELAPRRPAAPYLDLDLPGGQRWTFEHLAELGGHAAALDALVAAGDDILLGGGHAPVWAYLAAMHRVLDQRPRARLSVFAPKEAGGLVQIPETVVPDPQSPLTDQLTVAWTEARGAGVLELQIITADRFLRGDAFGAVGHGPLPTSPMPPGRLLTSGKAPTWLHLTYARWLRGVASGRALGTWTAGERGVFYVSPRDAAAFEPWDLPPPPGGPGGRP